MYTTIATFLNHSKGSKLVGKLIGSDLIPVGILFNTFYNSFWNEKLNT